MNKKPVIAIDGFSSTGKSSISKVIAQKLDLIHIDTGALYRGITYFALENCLNDSQEIDIKSLFEKFDQIHLEFILNNGVLELFLNGKNIDKEIREPRVSDHVSLIAKQAEVRAFLLDFQRNLAQKGGVIMDGRDIGTCVLPHADVKVYLTASVETRAKRRYQELQEKGEDCNLEEIAHDIEERDRRDMTREIAPLKQAEDAVLVDSSDMTIAEVVKTIVDLCR